ncbi:MAG: acyltransferase [Bacteroidales bacterium]|nr:acyltransferase [Bacteroidales bacterium]
MLRPRMVWGYRHPGGRWLPATRVSNSTFIDHPEGLDIGDNVFIGHFNYIDASGGIRIGKGTQVTNFISLTTHSSHISIRLYGSHYQDHTNHLGYEKGPVEIGEYCFIGPHSVIMPGTKIGKGSILAAYSYVQGDFPDFSVIRGNPAQRTGDTRELDKKYLDGHPEIREYYKQWAGELPGSGEAV